MEFQGRIAKLLPIRQGVSQRTGNEWKSLPFIFEYFEHDSDRYADSVMLETFDTNTMKQIAPYCVTDQEGKAVIENGRLFLDTNKPTQVKMWCMQPIKAELENPTLFLSDIYFDLLLNGLCVKLCVKYKLTDYIPIFEQQFKQAKNLIKRSNATQRMFQRGDLGGGYNDSFYNGLGGVGW